MVGKDAKEVHEFVSDSDALQKPSFFTMILRIIPISLILMQAFFLC
jgi:hypothetical protein